MGWGRSGSRSPTVALVVIQTTRLVTGLQANRKGTRNRPFQGGKDRFYFSMTALEACGLDTCTAPGRGDLRSSGRRGQETRAEQVSGRRGQETRAEQVSGRRGQKTRAQ